VLHVEVKDTTGNAATDISSFTTRGVAFGISHPADGSINVSANADITFYADRLDKNNTLNVKINGNYAISNGAFQSGYSDNGSGQFGPNYPWRIIINPTTDFSFYSTNTIEIWAADLMGLL